MGALKMNKEQILELSRQENKQQDIYELDIINKAQRIGGITALLVACVLMMLDHTSLKHSAHFGYLLIISSALVALWGYKVAKMKKKHEIAVLAVSALLFIYAAVSLIISIAG